MNNPFQTLYTFNEHLPTYLKAEDADRDTLCEYAYEMIAETYPVVQFNVDKVSEEDFKKIRSNAFGASDSSVLLGVAYNTASVAMKTVDDLLREKIEEVSDEEIGKKPSVRKGKELEPLLISKFETRLDATIIKPKHMFGSDFGMHTNFDGILFEAYAVDTQTQCYRMIPLEIKLCTQFGRKNYDWKIGISEFSTNKTMQPDALLPIVNYPNVNIREHIEMNAARYGIPAYYYTQLQQQMMFLKAPHGYLGVMDDAEWTLYMFMVPRDQRTIKELMQAVTRSYTKLARAKGLKTPIVPDSVSII